MLLISTNEILGVLGLLWIEINFGEKKNELSPHLKISPFFSKIPSIQMIP
jgi:hypothetical protein